MRAAVAVGIVGAALRLALFSINPPNNTYDDHLEPIAIVARDERLPSAAECWECYQPPLYYIASAAVLIGVVETGGSYWYGWRAVQFMSIVASVITLAAVWALLTAIGPAAYAA